MTVTIRDRTGFHSSGRGTTPLTARSAFTFRFLDAGEEEEVILEASERAEEAAKAWLSERGYGTATRTSDPRPRISPRRH